MSNQQSFVLSFFLNTVTIRISGIPGIRMVSFLPKLNGHLLDLCLLMVILAIQKTKMKTNSEDLGDLDFGDLNTKDLNYGNILL